MGTTINTITAEDVKGEQRTTPRQSARNLSNFTRRRAGRDAGHDVFSDKIQRFERKPVRDFDRGMDIGSRKESASKQESKARFWFNQKQKAL